MAEQENQVCNVCKAADNEDSLLLCDGCDRAYHTFCCCGCDCCGEKPKGAHFKKAMSIPEGDWFCKHCTDHPKSKNRGVTNMYGWGSNECGQLGLGSIENNIKVLAPCEIVSLKGHSIQSISCGEDFTVVATGEGQVYSAGNGCEGRLGHNDLIHESLASFRRIQTLDRAKRAKSDGNIIRLASGRHFTFALAESGSLYSFGSGEKGQLGHQENKDKKIPKKISALKQMELEIDLIACGGEHVLMTSRELSQYDQFNVAKPGVLLSMGNNSHGQLGDDSGKNQWVPQQLNKEGVEFTGKPSRDDNETPPTCRLGRDVKQLAGGESHSVALTGNGGVWTWGHGQVGQLGHPIPELPPGRSTFFKPQFVVGRPRFVQALYDVYIDRIACGKKHTLVVSKKNNKVYVFGDTSFGQATILPQNETNFQALPYEIKALTGKNIERIACGDEHCAVVSADGDVYTWGRCTEGQLGLGAMESDVQCVAEPSKVNGLGFIEDIYCGGSHTIALGKASKKRGATEAEPAAKRTKT